MYAVWCPGRPMAYQPLHTTIAPDKPDDCADESVYRLVRVRKTTELLTSLRNSKRTMMPLYLARKRRRAVAATTRSARRKGLALLFSEEISCSQAVLVFAKGGWSLLSGG